MQAAELIDTTQSTISYRIQALEKQLGQSLILRARGARQVSLTEAGVKFLDLAERWEMLQFEVDQSMATSERYLSIGSVDALAIYVLPGVFSALALETPKIRLHLETGLYWSLLTRVASGHLAYAFTFTPVERNDLVSEHVRAYPMKVAYMPLTGGRLDAEVDITALDPLNEVHLRWSGEIDLWRQKRGLSRLITSIDRSHLLAPLLAREGAWALVPEFMMEDLARRTNCTFHSLKRFPPPDVRVYLTRRRTEVDLSNKNRASLDTALKLLVPEQKPVTLVPQRKHRKKSV